MQPQQAMPDALGRLFTVSLSLFLHVFLTLSAFYIKRYFDIAWIKVHKRRRCILLSWVRVILLSRTRDSVSLYLLYDQIQHEIHKEQRLELKYAIFGMVNL